MICKKCGKDFEGKFCPECATAAVEVNTPVSPTAPTQMPRKKYKTSTIVLVIIGVVVFVGVMGAALGDDESEPVSVTSKPQSNSVVAPASSKAASVPVEKKTEFGINDPATYKNTKLTVTAVEKTQGSQYDKPKDGMEFVIVTVEYENVGTDRISYNPYDFEIQNSQGQINSQTFSIANTETALGSGDLAGGGKISGTIIFEQPKDDADLTLLYTGSILSNNEKLTFKLQ